MKTKHLRLHAARLSRPVLLLHVSCPSPCMIVFSFNESKSRTVFTGFTFKWYQNLFHNDMVLNSPGRVRWAWPLSAAVHRHRGGHAGRHRHQQPWAISAPGAPSWHVSYVPVVNPEIITGVSLMLLFVVFNRQRQRDSSRGFCCARWSYHGPRPGHAAHRAHRVLPALCHLQRQRPSCKPAGLRPFTRQRWTWAAIPRQAFFKVVLPRAQRRPSCRRSSSA